MDEGSTIKLEQAWTLGAKLTEGGFGEIFLSHPGGKEVIKLIPKLRGTKRELLFVDLPDIPNVIPILDSGKSGARRCVLPPDLDPRLLQTQSRQAVRMARPSDGLQVHINSRRASPKRCFPSGNRVRSV